MTEAQEQKAIFDWSRQPTVRGQYPELKLLHHIPNGGKRDAIEAKHLKAQGVKKGVPDLCLPVARGPYHGAYIELKTQTGRDFEFSEKMVGGVTAIKIRVPEFTAKKRPMPNRK